MPENDEGSTEQRVVNGGGRGTRGGRTSGGPVNRGGRIRGEGSTRGGRVAGGRRGGMRGRGRGRSSQVESPARTRPSTPDSWENPEVEVEDFTPPILRQRRKTSGTREDGEGPQRLQRRRALNFEDGFLHDGADPRQESVTLGEVTESMVPTTTRTKILNHRNLYAVGDFPKDVFIPAKKLIGVPKKWSRVDRFLASVHSMYTNVATGEEIYRVNFAGTTGVVDIRAADCIDVSIKMALAEYRGIPALPSGSDHEHRSTTVATFDTDGEEGGDNNSDSDTFSEEFLTKCGIYPGDRLYKPKHKAGTVKESGPSQRQSVPGTSEADLLQSQFLEERQLGFGFSSPVRTICQIELLPDESDSSDWEAMFHDFPEADPYTQDSDHEATCSRGLDLLYELGIYPQNMGNLNLEEKYAESMWESRACVFDGTRNTFTGPKPGPTRFYGRRKPEVQSFFSQFWPIETLKEIVNQTNLYAGQKRYGSDGSGTTKLNGGPNWKKLTIKSLKAWMGIVIYIGLKNEPALKDYWSTDAFFGCPIIKNIMSRDRFLSILRNIHLVDSSKLCTDKSDPRFDKLGKVRWLVDSFVSLCKKYLNPGKFLTVDEIMVAYKGRYCSFQQYMMNKPIQYGIKVYATACSVTRYLWNFEIYLGAQTEPSTDDQLLGAQVVLRLTDDLSHRGHCIVVDNYFTGVRLFDTLLSKGFFATGTCKSTAKLFPKTLTGHHKSDHESRGTIFYKMHASNQMAGICWFDSQIVHFLSTHASPISVNCFTQRWIHGRHVLLPTCPVILEYITHMRGIDVVDHRRANYTCQLRTRKWWHRIFLFLVDSSIGNAYVLYDLDCQMREIRPMSRKAFHHRIAAWLCSGCIKPGRTTFKGFPMRRGLHYSMRHPERKRCKCRVCGRKQVRVCRACGGKYICEGACFVKAHSKAKWASRVLSKW